MHTIQLTNEIMLIKQSSTYIFHIVWFKALLLSPQLLLLSMSDHLFFTTTMLLLMSANIFLKFQHYDIWATRYFIHWRKKNWINSENYNIYAKFVTKDFLDFTF